MDRAPNGRRMYRHAQYVISLQEQTCRNTNTSRPVRNWTSWRLSSAT
jgi:hypothetical protein